MTDLRPRADRPGRARPIARHGRLRRRGPGGTIAKIVASVVAVSIVSAAGIGAVAVGDLVGSIKKGIGLIGASGGTEIVGVDAMKGAFNVLLAGSDSGGGDPAYGPRGENLNDVTMMMHVSADHQHVTVVSFPRDMQIAIPACPKEDGSGYYSAMSQQRINVTLSYGGLACTVLTVEQLTGLNIGYAAEIQMDGVIRMADAVGGVPVCVGKPIYDPNSPVFSAEHPAGVPLSLPAGLVTLTGGEALAFLRTRHGVGDGSDLGRISNQQVYLSSLVRTVTSNGTIGNPLKLYSLAKAALSNVSFSQSLASASALVSVALAVKDVKPSSFVFVQFPTEYGAANGLPSRPLFPNPADAAILVNALQKDLPVTVTGGTGANGVGSSVTASAYPTQTAAPTGKPTGTTASSSSSSASSATSSTATPASSGVPSSSATGTGAPTIDLGTGTYGQTAAEETCSTAFHY